MRGLLLILTVALLAGCAKPSAMLPGHRADDRVDGELFAGHFDGDELNPMGLAKIDAIPADARAVIVIHVTPATDRNVFVRRGRDVRLYAATRGLKDARICFSSDLTDEPDRGEPDPAMMTTACVADDNR